MPWTERERCVVDKEGAGGGGGGRERERALCPPSPSTPNMVRPDEWSSGRLTSSRYALDKERERCVVDKEGAGRKKEREREREREKRESERERERE